MIQISIPSTEFGEFVSNDLRDNGYLLSTPSNSVRGVEFVPGDEFEPIAPTMTRELPNYKRVLDVNALNKSGKLPQTPVGDFGKLTVESWAGRQISKRTRKNFWNMRCECGNPIIAETHYLKIGRAQSCGCAVRVATWKSKYKGCGLLPMKYYSHLIRNAELRNLEFKITIQYALALFIGQNGKCAYTKCDLSFGNQVKIGGRMERGDKTASLDRIDSKRGYVFGNVQWVHKSVNVMKASMTHEEFVWICGLIAKNHPRF